MNKNSILKVAQAYTAHTGLKFSTVSTYAANDGKWLPNLKASPAKSCTLRKAERVLQWFSDHWPDADLEWPSDIPRPPKSKEAA